MKPIQQVIDENGAAHTLIRRIGTGGQGEVWLAEGGRRIVKLLARGEDPEALRRQFTFLRRLDLTGLHVAKPLAVLKPPHVGYVAEFLGDMMSIGELLRAPTKGLSRWHIETGGLRRRLRLLAHAGEALLGLHGRGVVYGDVSHHNIFVSTPIAATEAWLIDLDNLSHDSDPLRAIYTPGYGAPEIVAGSAGCTSLSDAWAFAALAYQTLTLTHPFVGDMVSEGEPELEEQAFAGKLPWVGCKSDDRNTCTTGLPHDAVLGPRLLDVARKTFEDGRDNRRIRPGVAEWVSRLHGAADRTVTCSACSGTYFVTAKACPWCEEPPPRVLPVRFERWQPGVGIVPAALRLGPLPLTTAEFHLTRRVTQGTSGPEGRVAHIELTLVDRGVSVRTLNDHEVWVAEIAQAHQVQHAVSGRKRTVPDAGWMVFFDDPTQPQRVALLGGKP